MVTMMGSHPLQGQEILTHFRKSKCATHKLQMHKDVFNLSFGLAPTRRYSNILVHLDLFQQDLKMTHPDPDFPSPISHQTLGSDRSIHGDFYPTSDGFVLHVMSLDQNLHVAPHFSWTQECHTTHVSRVESPVQHTEYIC